jgi:cysteinyl-tRNA synthetase
MIKFYNTLSGKKEEFKSIKPGKVKLYTCGPTVYDYAHIGNFRAYLFEDILKRFLIYMGYEVKHVMNITDVDDKTIKKANSEGKSLKEVTEKYIKAFFEDIDTLNILRADHYPKATEHIKEMAHMVKVLVQKGYGYKKDGSYYFDISKFKDYGKLSKINRDELRTGERVESDEYEKKNAHDFALWKEKKPNEPYWDTEIGQGRPGWHIECSVMSTKYLGQPLDIHCGGVDNIFPHHENEMAQSESYAGKKFVHYWLHCRHLIVEGNKMSKSKGNQYTLRDLIKKGIDPVVLRYLLLSTHYRKMLNFSFDTLDQSESSLERIKDFLYELKTRSFKSGENHLVKKLISIADKKFVESLSDDLNISKALTAVFELIRDVNKLVVKNQIYESDSEMIQSTFKKWDSVLGILPGKEDEKLEASIKKKIELREKARKEKNYELADQIRDELLEKGIVLEDTKDGVRWKKK